MKKLISILLFVAIIFSFCMTGVSASALSPEEITEKYGALIDAVEAGNYPAADEELKKLFPGKEISNSAEEKAEYEVIELTTENFYDYYDLVQEESYCERDSKGNIKWLEPGGYMFVLKEEYKSRCDWKDIDVTVGLTAKKSYYRAKINWDTGEIKLGDKASDDVRKAINKQLSFLSTKLDTQISVQYASSICGVNIYYRDPDNKAWVVGSAKPGNKIKYYVNTWKINLESVEGTLYLKPEAELEPKNSDDKEMIKKDLPLEEQITLREGMYIVGEDIQPGKYKITCTETEGEKMADAYSSLGDAYSKLGGDDSLGSLFGSLGGMMADLSPTTVEIVGDYGKILKSFVLKTGETANITLEEGTAIKVSDGSCVLESR